ncbi:MAG TPA: hypothetical protein VFW47_17540 [Phenylobacterium sp.]|nr:hypothetical protein [Phenylobacterium sp.]
MDRVPFPIIVAASLALAAAAACDGPPRAPEPPKREAADAGYVAPPRVTALQLAGTEVSLSGTGAPKATVRLASPRGEAVATQIDATGQWRLQVPARPTAAIYGLSQTAAGRTVQSEGYLLITPEGAGVLLRAGGGALAIGAGPGAGVTGFDMDRDGGAVVSGRGPAGGAVSARIDGHKLGESRSDAQGHFAIPLTGPVSPGRHSLKVFGDSIDSTLIIDATPAAPLVDGPFRTNPAPSGLRVDWMTPGGGVQSTLVVDRSPLSGEPPHRVLP